MDVKFLLEGLMSNVVFSVSMLNIHTVWNIITTIKCVKKQHLHGHRSKKDSNHMEVDLKTRLTSLVPALQTNTYTHTHTLYNILGGQRRLR